MQWRGLFSAQWTNDHRDWHGNSGWIMEDKSEKATVMPDPQNFPWSQPRQPRQGTFLEQSREQAGC